MNIQITEDYISFEVAKLLKEKGFNEHCFASFIILMKMNTRSNA